MRLERCVGLTPYVADSRHQYDLPDSLYTTSPYHAGFDGVDPPPDFLERFCLETLPYYYRNNPKANYDYGPIHDPTDICMPALWCDEPTIVAYSKEGYESKTWELPPDWKGVTSVATSRIALQGHEPVGSVDVVDGRISLQVGGGEALKVCPQ